MQNYILVDSHCHLHDREFFTEQQAEEMLERARARGVEKIICIGTSYQDSLAAKEFAAGHEGVYWTFGVHPENAGTPWHFDADLVDNKLVGIGEVGLDYHYAADTREQQIRLLEEMLQLALDQHLSLSFHVREGYDDFFPIVANFPATRGVLHCFTDSRKNLRRILDETIFYVGVNGIMTYTTPQIPPLERALIETDAPFLAPVPHRGETNEPAYIADIAKWLSSATNTDLDQVARLTTKNANMLFDLDQRS